MKVELNQSFLDIAIQETGTINTIFDIAVDNNMSITDLLVPGKSVSIPARLNGNNDVLDYYKKKGVKVAASNNLQTGIGSYIIGSTFTIGQ